jgi:hypothetical protein
MGIEKEGLGQCARRGNKHSFDLPIGQNFVPARAELNRPLELAEQVIAVKVRTAIHEHSIAGIKIPDRVAAPIVVNEDPLGLVAGP